MSTHMADTFGLFSTMIRFFHSSASSVPVWRASRSSSSSYGQTAPGYYSSYSCTSGGSVSFHHWVGYFPWSLMLHHLISHCPHLMIFIPAILTHLPYLPHLILLAVVPLVPIPPGITLGFPV